MAIRNLTNWSDPLFRKASKPVTKFDDRLAILLEDMRDTLERVKGYGCAAVHVGILRRVVVVLDEGGVIELINPTISEASTKMERVLEGSIAPGAPRGYVERPNKVTVSALDRHGESITVMGEGFLAATFCHEIDHLDGIIFTDKVHPGEAGE
ncbi:MAG: peptide deformylase [Defluviitaleaceae bacterium]|nr:peptide deformylase [Defluviitaleaceae bacterium]MCL2238378.1 peptide deformylase [Defluviitaleaceae bacterium]